MEIKDVTIQALRMKSEFSLTSYKPGESVAGILLASLPDGSKFEVEPTYSFTLNHNNRTIGGSALEKMSIEGSGYFGFKLP
jgi:hypothetical protein